jgi:hypothetical protein
MQRTMTMYQVVILLMSVSLILVMILVNHQRTEIRQMKAERAKTADDLFLLQTKNQTQRRVYRNDQAYIEQLEERLARHEDYRDVAALHARVRQSETGEERDVRERLDVSPDPKSVTEELAVEAGQ